MVPMIFTGHIMKVYGKIGPKNFDFSECLIIQIQFLVPLTSSSPVNILLIFMLYVDVDCQDNEQRQRVLYST